MSIEQNKDKPAIEIMGEEELLESICTLIKLTDLEWTKFETFYWHYAEQIANRYYLKQHLNALKMGMYNMLMEKSQQETRVDKVRWMK